MRLIRSVALVTVAFLNLGAWAQGSPPTAFPPDTQTLSPQVLQERLAGKRFTSRYTNGITAAMHYGADQTIQMELSNGLSARGTWRVDGSQVCFQFQTVPSGCSEVRAVASHIYQRRYTNQEVIELHEAVPDATTHTIPARPMGAHGQLWC